FPFRDSPVFVPLVFRRPFTTFFAGEIVVRFSIVRLDEIQQVLCRAQSIAVFAGRIRVSIRPASGELLSGNRPIGSLVGFGLPLIIGLSPVRGGAIRMRPKKDRKCHKNGEQRAVPLLQRTLPPCEGSAGEFGIVTLLEVNSYGLARDHERDERANMRPWKSVVSTGSRGTPERDYRTWTILFETRGYISYNLKFVYG